MTSTRGSALKRTIMRSSLLVWTRSESVDRLGPMAICPLRAGTGSRRQFPLTEW
jgi:hypothetical protein